MTFQSQVQKLMARVNGQPSGHSPVESELLRLIAAADDARSRDPQAALGLYQQALDRARAVGSLPGEEMIEGLIGQWLTERGQYEEAETALNNAITTAEKTGDRARRARAIGNLGAHYVQRGLPAKAQPLLETALEQARQAVSPAVTATILANLGAVYLVQDNPSYALRLLKEAAALYQTLPAASVDLAQFSFAIGQLGLAHQASGEAQRTYKLLTQAEKLAQQAKMPAQELLWATALAESLYDNQDYSQALQLYVHCDELSARLNAQGTPLPLAQQDAVVTRQQLIRASLYERLNQYDQALIYANRALDQARAAIDHRAEARALTLIGDIYKATDRVPEAISALEAAVQLYTEAPASSLTRPDTATVEAHIETTLTLGGLYQAHGERERGFALFDEALALTERTPGADRLARARTLRRIGSALSEQGDLSRALERWTEALDIFERAGQPAVAARLLCDMAMLRRQVGGISAALPDYERATMLLGGLKEPVTRGLVLSNVANVYTDLGEIETAASFYQEALQLARQNNDRRAETLRLGNYGWFHVATGQTAQAISLLEEALAISRPMGDNLLVAVQLNNLAQTYVMLRDYQTAQGLFDQAAELIAVGDYERWRALIRSNQGRVLALQGQTDAALPLYEQALASSRTLGDQENVARTMTRIADIQLSRGQIAEAESATRDAEVIARKWGYRKGQADALVVRAGALRARGEIAAADQTLTEALRLYSILHDPLAAELKPVQAV